MSATPMGASVSQAQVSGLVEEVLPQGCWSDGDYLLRLWTASRLACRATPVILNRHSSSCKLTPKCSASAPWSCYFRNARIKPSRGTRRVPDNQFASSSSPSKELSTK